mgnify:CR=1 FL=1
MNRYQIYLNSSSVGVLDQVSKEIKLSRSQIIRDVIDKMASEYKKLLVSTEARRLENNPLLKMAGFAKGPGKDISHNVDEIYLKD